MAAAAQRMAAVRRVLLAAAAAGASGLRPAGDPSRLYGSGDVATMRGTPPTPRAKAGRWPAGPVQPDNNAITACDDWLRINATGVGDESALFQAAAATGRSLFVPDGVYFAEGMVLKVAGQQLRGNGFAAEIRSVSGQRPIVTLANEGTAVRHLRFAANASGPSEDNNAIQVTSGTSAGNGNRWQIENVQACSPRCSVQGPPPPDDGGKGSFTATVYLKGAGYGIISGWSEFQTGTHSAIYAHHGAWLDISGSMIWDTSSENSTTTLGKIVLVDNPGVHIHGNYITRGRSPGILATANASLFSNNELHVRPRLPSRGLPVR